MVECHCDYTKYRKLHTSKQFILCYVNFVLAAWVGILAKSLIVLKD